MANMTIQERQNQGISDSWSLRDFRNKMGKMQIKNIETSAILNCVLWEEALNRIPDISTRVGNIIRFSFIYYKPWISCDTV